MSDETTETARSFSEYRAALTYPGIRMTPPGYRIGMTYQEYLDSRESATRREQ